ncbi:hypothetical protein Ancab_032794 [Ancistrocladus abbreviatus]
MSLNDTRWPCPRHCRCPCQQTELQVLNRDHRTPALATRRYWEKLMMIKLRFLRLSLLLVHLNTTALGGMRRVREWWREIGFIFRRLKGLRSVDYPVFFLVVLVYGRISRSMRNQVRLQPLNQLINLCSQSAADDSRMQQGVCFDAAMRRGYGVAVAVIAGNNIPELLSSIK